MLTITFTDQDLHALDQARHAHTSPIIRRRAEALYLKAKGLRHTDIQRVCAISRTTLASYIHIFHAGGIAAVTRLQHQGQPSALNAYQTQIEAHFRAHPPQTVAQAQAMITEQTGIHRSPTQIRAFLRRMGMQLRHTATMPAHATEPDQQRTQTAFHRDQLAPRLADVRNGKRSLFS